MSSLYRQQNEAWIFELAIKNEELGEPGKDNFHYAENTTLGTFY